MIKPNVTWAHLLLLTISFVGARLTTGKAQSAIEGQWHNEEKGGIIHIYEEGGMIYAHLVGAENPEENKKIQASDKKVVIFRDFQQKSETKWCCGTILQPRENRELSGTLILQDEQTLKVVGRMGIFSGSTFWKRV